MENEGHIYIFEREKQILEQGDVCCVSIGMNHNAGYISHRYIKISTSEIKKSILSSVACFLYDIEDGYNSYHQNDDEVIYALEDYRLYPIMFVYDSWLNIVFGKFHDRLIHPDAKEVYHCSQLNKLFGEHFYLMQDIKFAFDDIEKCVKHDALKFVEECKPEPYKSERITEEDLFQLREVHPVLDLDERDYCGIVFGINGFKGFSSFHYKKEKFSNCKRTKEYVLESFDDIIKDLDYTAPIIQKTHSFKTIVDGESLYSSVATKIYHNKDYVYIIFGSDNKENDTLKKINLVNIDYESALENSFNQEKDFREEMKEVLSLVKKRIERIPVKVDKQKESNVTANFCVDLPECFIAPPLVRNIVKEKYMPKYKIGDKVSFKFGWKRCQGEIYDILKDPDEYAIVSKDLPTREDGVVVPVLEVDEYMEKKDNK
jgi:hypothetical protein